MIVRRWLPALMRMDANRPSLDRIAEEVVGPVDAFKLRSSLTLFGEAAGFVESDDSGRFAAALARWFGRQKDTGTLDLLTADPTRAANA